MDRALLSRDPSTYGRASFGTTVISRTQENETANSTAPAVSRWPSRLRSAAGDTTKYATASASTMIHACIIAAWKASPTQTAASSRGRSRPVPIAFAHWSAASTRHMVSGASSSACPNIDAATGVRVSTPAASRPAAGPRQRRTVRWITRTLTTPSTHCGSVRAQLLNPKIRADSACGHRKPPILSRVTVDAGSKAVKRNAFQLSDMLRTAAA